MTMVNRDDCRTGEFYDPLRGCQLCSVVQSPYQMVLCPCEPSRDAVIGCRSSSFGSNICRPLSAAVDECIRRGYTSSRAPSTTAAAGSATVPSVASTRSSSAAAFPGDSMQPSSTTVSGSINGNDPSSLSLDAQLLLTLGLGVSFLILLLLMGASYVVWLRRKTLRRRRFRVEEHEAEAKLIDRNSLASPLNVNNVSTPQVVVVNGTVPYVDPKPNVINNYSVIVKNSQFTQNGSHNVICVGSQVASAIGSASDSNSEDEEQVFSADDSDALGDVNFVSVTSYLSDGAGVGEVSFYHPMQGNDVDLGEAGNACPGNAEKSNTGEMRTEGFVSASRTGEERCQIPQASLEPAEAGTVSERSSVPGLLECSEELTGTRDRGNESAAPDISHMPIENADFCSQPLPESTKVPPASLPSGGTGSHIDSEPLHSPPCDKEWRTPSVGGLCAGGAMASLAPVSSSLSSRYDSVDCGGDKESFPVHPQALQSINADKPGMLASLSEPPTGEAIPNVDDDPTLPKQTTDSLPLLSVIDNHA